MKSLYRKEGAHYNIFSGLTIDDLRRIFPDAEADEMNFTLFSTSGIHGAYTTIEEIESSLKKYGVNPDFGNADYPDDYVHNSITVLVVHPRIVCMKYADMEISLSDIDYLKKLRKSSHEAVLKIGV